MYSQLGQNPASFSLLLQALDNGLPKGRVLVGSQASWYEKSHSLPQDNELSANNF